MKAKDITAGEAYRVSAGYGNRMVKATVLDAPVQTRRGGRESGPRNAARIRFEQPVTTDWPRRAVGDIVTVPLAKVIAPWSEEDDERTAQLDALHERVAAVRAKLESLGMPATETWRGEEASAEVCTVSLPFVEFEAWLGRIDPVTVAGDAMAALMELGRQKYEEGEARHEVLTELAERLAAGDAIEPVPAPSTTEPF